MKTKVFFSLLALPILFFGQINNHFEHSNSKWYAARTVPGGNNQDLSFSKTGTTVYGFIGDTLINNVQWFKMHSSSDSTFQTNLIFQGLMRTENKRVFFQSNFFTKSPNQIDTLYDFNLSVGDSTKYYFPYDDMGTGVFPPTYMKITAIDSIQLLDGQFYKRFKFKSPFVSPGAVGFVSSVHEVWIEGIGSIYGVLYPSAPFGFITSGPPADSLRLTCSFSSNQQIWQHSGYAKCYALISGLKNESVNDFNIFPNPANTSIHIQLQNEMLGKTKIEITNIAGQLVKSIPANTDSSLEIPTNDLKNGMYFITLSVDEKRITKKLMIQH